MLTLSPCLHVFYMKLPAYSKPHTNIVLSNCSRFTLCNQIFKAHVYLLNKLAKSRQLQITVLVHCRHSQPRGGNRQLSVVIPDLVTRIVVSRAQRLLASVIRQRVRLAARFKRFTIPLRSAQCAESGFGGVGRTEMEVCVCFFIHLILGLYELRLRQSWYTVSPSLSDVCGRFRSSKVEAWLEKRGWKEKYWKRREMDKGYILRARKGQKLWCGWINGHSPLG